MQIRTSGKPKKIDIRVCKQAINFYSSLLMSNRLSETLQLTLEFVPFLKNESFIGFCGWDDDNVNPKVFTITINENLNRRHTLLALAHEMVHLKQYATNELKDYSAKNKVRWRGNKFDINNIEYWDHPWEIEAYGRELGLYARFKEYLKVSKK